MLYRKYTYSLSNVLFNMLLILVVIGISLLFSNRHTLMITMFITLGIISVFKLLLDFFEVIDTSKWLYITCSVAAITLIFKYIFN